MENCFRARLVGRVITISAFFFAQMAAAAPPSGCTDISHVPVVNNIEYGAAIQSLFVQFSTNPAAGCADCHTSSDGTQTPAGHLNLDPNDTSAQNPYANIVNVQSYNDPSLDYVVPKHPELSLLFMKVNCDNPPVGSRMPFGMTDLFTPEQQALIYDWIEQGAQIFPGDTVFYGTFEYRGLPY